MSWAPSGRFTDPRTREGELAWPLRVPEREVASLEEMLGELGRAGQLQQRPVPRGGGIVRREHFLRYSRTEIQATLDRAEFFDFQALTTDAAFKDTKGSSYVVIQAWGRRGIKNYLLGQIRERMTFTKTIQNLRQMRSDYPLAHAVLIEDKANGPAIIDTLKDEIPGIIPIEPTGSKPARAEAAAPLIQAGNVLVPLEEEAPWVEAFISEWCAVPTGAFWDQVDASDQYLNKYGRQYSINIDAGAVVAESTLMREDSGSPWEDQ